jgi:surface antigen
MSVVVIDDHLLGDVVGGMVPTELAIELRQNVIATTNLYYYRLCRAALVARGGALTGSWSPERRGQAARALVALSPEIEMLPIRTLAFRMAELARDHQLSALGAEAVAAAEASGGSLVVWEGDDGRNIRACCEAVGVPYGTIARE